MKTNRLIFAIAIITLFVAQASAQRRYCRAHHQDHVCLPTNGFILRGNYWNVIDNNQSGVSVINHHHGSSVNVEGFGGSLVFFSQLDNQMYMDFSIGAVGSAETIEQNIDYDLVEVKAVVPLLAGLRYELVPANSLSAIRPYISGGLGLYWLNDIEVLDYFGYEEETVVETHTRGGSYLGGGANFMFGRNFALNWDVRHHWVDFPAESHYKDGLDFSLGLSIMWGHNHR